VAGVFIDIIVDKGSRVRPPLRGTGDVAHVSYIGKVCDFIGLFSSSIRLIIRHREIYACFQFFFLSFHFSVRGVVCGCHNPSASSAHPLGPARRGCSLCIDHFPSHLIRICCMNTFFLTCLPFRCAYGPPHSRFLLAVLLRFVGSPRLSFPLLLQRTPVSDFPLRFAFLA
jgi:hypothetical protein